MAFVDTRMFGRMEYDDSSAFSFPRGLPGFEAERTFVPVQLPASHPLLFLQSAADPDLCFITLPVLAVDRQYRLKLEAEECAAVGLDCDPPPAIGRDVLCLAIVTIPPEGEPTANLLSPLVVNVKTRVGAQIIQQDSGYSHCHPIPPAGESEAPCS